MGLKTFLAAMSLLVLIALPAGAAVLKILIDPGHGGNDSGAIRGQLKESDIALKVSRLLKAKLDSNSGFTTEMTRTTDRNINLHDRVKRAEEVHADLFLSIHLNTNYDPRARGTEIYFQNHLPADEETLFLASTENNQNQSTGESLVDEPTKRNDVVSIIDDLQRHRRLLMSRTLSLNLHKAWNAADHHVTIRQAPFQVVINTSIPSVLVELGFISNPQEADRLSNEGYQSQLADRIYRGLMLYKAQIDRGAPVPMTEKN